MKINGFIILRVLIGGFFVVSGLEKVISPYQNFLYVVQNYQFLSPVLEKTIAHIVPWLELLLGTFVLLGLWLNVSLRVLLVLTAGFIMVVGQAIARHLPIDKCGCFGQLISVPLQGTLLIDSLLLILIGSMILSLNKTSEYSLDRWFENH